MISLICLTLKEENKMYNLKLKRVYKKPQNSSIKKDWSKKDNWSTGTFYSLLDEKNLPNRIKIGA